MDRVIKKAEELSNHIGNARMILIDILGDLEDYQKELVTLAKELNNERH